MTAHQYAQGGVGKVVYKLAEALKKEGVEVDVLEKGWNKPYELHRSNDSASTVTANSFAQLQRSGLDLASYDLLHIHSINLAWTGALKQICDTANIPTVYTAHSVVSHEKELYEKTGQDVPKWMREDIKAQDQVVKVSDKLFLLTDPGKKIAERHYGESISVVPNGVDHVKVPDEISQLVKKTYAPLADDVLLYVGRITPDKGVKELVDSFPRIQEEYRKKTGKRMELLMVGPCQEEKPFMDSVQKSIAPEYRDSIKFVGEVTDPALMAAFYNAASWHILPTKHDSFPGVTLEAMIQGTPTIGTNVDGLSDIIKDKVNGLHINPKSLKSHDLNEGIVEAMSYAMDHKKEMAEMAKTAQQSAQQKYNWRNIAKLALSEYDSVVQSKGRTVHKPIANKRKISLEGKRIGIVGHFAYKNGAIADGVARWCEGAMSSLKKSGHDVSGIGIVGESRDGVEVVRGYSDIGEAISKSDFDVCIIRGNEQVAKEALAACRARGIKSLWVQPYWGVWQGVYDLVNQADATIVPTEEYAEVLSAQTGKEVQAIPFPLDTNTWKPRAFNKIFDEPNVAYVGRVTKDKDLSKLITPFKRVRSRFPRAKLSIIGPGDEETNIAIQQAARENGFEGSLVRVDKRLTSEEVGEAYASADVFVFPTNESYGQSNLEAILTGTPVVTFDAVPFAGYRVPSMSWMHGYKYSANPLAPDMWNDFADKISDVLEDPVAARLHTASFSNDLRNNFSWDALKTNLVGSLESVLTEKAA